MDLHQLFVFTKVVEHKSFSKAADDIFLSQSTVSSHIKALEKNLNLQLFDRDCRHAMVTPYGERLYQWAKQMLLLKDQAILDLQEDQMDFQGTIRIAASSVPGCFILPNVIKKFQKDYPAVTFHVSESSSKMAAETVLRRTVDIGVLGKKYEDEKLCYFPIEKDKLVLITSNELNLGNRIYLDEIIKHPLISRHSDSGTQDAVDKALRKKGISKDQLHVAIYTDSSNSLIQYVKNGLGIAIISEMTAKEYANLGQIRMYTIEDFQDERSFYLVYHKNRTLSLVAKLFIEKVREWMEGVE